MTALGIWYRLRTGRAFAGRRRRNAFTGERAGLDIIHDVGVRGLGPQARLLASLRRRFVGLDLAHQKLFLCLTGTSSELRKLIGSKKKRSDDEDADDDRRVDYREKRM